MHSGSFENQKLFNTQRKMVHYAHSHNQSKMACGRHRSLWVVPAAGQDFEKVGVCKDCLRALAKLEPEIQRPDCPEEERESETLFDEWQESDLLMSLVPEEIGGKRRRLD